MGQPRTTSVTIALLLLTMGLSVSGETAPLLTNATRIFDPPLNAEHMVFSLSRDWVIWLITDKAGQLTEADVGQSRSTQQSSQMPRNETRIF